MLNNEKVITKKVFGILLESGPSLFLSVQYAYSLEEAFFLAKQEYKKQNRKEALGGKIVLFLFKTIDELTSTKENFTEIGEVSAKTKDVGSVEDVKNELEEIFDLITKENEKKSETKKDITEEEAKNNLMKEIIKNKDIKMFNKIKSHFSKEERKYIRSHLKK